MKKTLGQVLVPSLLVSFIGGAMIIILTNLAVANLYSVGKAGSSELAFQIAEAGIEYYRWHLAHASSDYQNGTGQPGPYTIPYNDKNGILIGQIILEITPPTIGSTVVTIVSTGKVIADPSVQRKIRSQLAIPSLARYATVANDVMRFGPGTEIFGPIHSNAGIRFDGVANNIVTSAQASYDDPDHSGGNEFAVHTHVNPTDPLPPTTVPNRPDVFRAGRQFPVPAVDFPGLTANLAQIKTDAQAAGRYFANSGGMGYYMILKTDDSFDLYRVNSLTSPPSGCNNLLGQTGWGTWSFATNTQPFLGNYTFPTNGLVFFEDHLWVRGQINTARLTIASGVFPETPTTNTSITVNNDLLYTNFDGQDVVSLIAQNNLNVGWASANSLTIDAALVAKNGRVGRYYYRPPTSVSNQRCAPYHVRNQITLYGTITTNQRYGFAYTDGTGYATRTITYDPNLLYAPPPSFPLTSSQYEIISWEEVR